MFVTAEDFGGRLWKPVSTEVSGLCNSCKTAFPSLFENAAIWLGGFFGTLGDWLSSMEPIIWSLETLLATVGPGSRSSFTTSAIRNCSHEICRPVLRQGREVTRAALSPVERVPKILILRSQACPWSPRNRSSMDQARCRRCTRRPARQSTSRSSLEARLW